MSKVLIIVLVVVGVLVLGGAGFVGYKMLYPPTVPVAPLPAPAVKTPAATPSAASQISLQIIQPTNGQVLSVATVNVVGKTVANAEVSVNDKDVKADAAGNFTAVVSLEEGDNPIMITAFDADGNMSEREITVTYNP